MCSRRRLLRGGAGLVGAGGMALATGTVSGRSSATADTEPATVEWEATVPQISSRTVLTEDTLYVGAQGLLAGLDPSTGGFRWQTSVEGSVQTLRRVEDDVVAITGTVDVSPENYQVRRVTSDGTATFRFPADPVDSQLDIAALTDDALYIGSLSSDVVRRSGEPFYALDARTGESRWQVETSSSPDVVVAGAHLVYRGPDSIEVRDRSTGEQRWRYPSSTPRGHDRIDVHQYAVRGATVYVEYAESERSRLAAFDLATGERGWTYEGRPGRARLGGGGRTVYVEADGGITALDGADGVERWRATRSAELRGSSVVGDSLLTAWADDVLTAYRPSDGTQLWLKRFDAEPRFVDHDGRVFVRVDGTGITALDPTDGTERWRWTHENFGNVHTGSLGQFVTDSSMFVTVRESGISIYRLDLASGTADWSYAVSGGPGVVAVDGDRTILVEQHAKRDEATVRSVTVTGATTTGSPEASPATDTGLPGFGPVAAVLGLAAGALTLGRWNSAEGRSAQ